MSENSVLLEVETKEGWYDESRYFSLGELDIENKKINMNSLVEIKKKGDFEKAWALSDKVITVRFLDGKTNKFELLLVKIKSKLNTCNK